jgi:mono/diheme cytochrome c family protein/glucose/arabinose dehydrogenase
MIKSPVFRNVSLTAAVAVVLSSLAWAANENNNFNKQPDANFKDIEIKFKQPIPAPLSAADELKTFKVEDGFKVELVVSDPAIEAPIAISFDDQGRMYVVEMRGFMTDLKGSKESEPIGRVTLFVDKDGDGKYETSSIFLDNLVMPRSVMAVNGGALVAVPPNLFFCKDTNGDGKADVKELVTNKFGSGSAEHNANTPIWTMDNNVWVAQSPIRYRLRNGAWQTDSGLARGQWGVTQDDFGRLFFNFNEDMLRCNLLPASAFGPEQKGLDKVLGYQVVTDQNVFPSHPTPGVNRGFNPGILRADGTLNRGTADCGPCIYRGDAFPAAYRGNAFVCDPASNVVKRFILTEKDGVITGENAVKGRDFLTSTDERFRPVQCNNGPDGALYIVDMYRGILQHKDFLTNYLAANIEARNLAEPGNRGRIWRVVPATGARPAAVKLPAQTAGRVAALGHPNGWVRDTAQRLLVESSAMDAVPLLAKMLAPNATTPLGRIHALSTLDGLGAVNAAMLKDALKDPDPKVRATAARVATPDAIPDLAALANDSDVLVRAHLAIRLAALGGPQADAIKSRLAGSGASSAVLSGALSAKGASGGGVVASTRPPKPANVPPLTAAQKTLFDQGKATYTKLCGVCHQPTGAGMPGLAPPLLDSPWALGEPDVAIRIVLNGVTGPITAGDVTWNVPGSIMPAQNNLSDEEIAGVLTYVRREWDHGAAPVDPQTVTAVREKYKTRNAPWTAEELKKP